MTWKHCVALLAIAPRRRVIVTALVYGLSLSVRFTSATGEEVEIPPSTSIVTRDDAPILPDNHWPLRPSEPIALQLGWPRDSRGCHASCARPMALTPSCDAP